MIERGGREDAPDKRREAPPVRTFEFERQLKNRAGYIYYERRRWQVKVVDLPDSIQDELPELPTKRVRGREQPRRWALLEADNIQPTAPPPENDYNIEHNEDAVSALKCPEGTGRVGLRLYSGGKLVMSVHDYKVPFSKRRGGIKYVIERDYIVEEDRDDEAEFPIEHLDFFKRVIRELRTLADKSPEDVAIEVKRIWAEETDLKLQKERRKDAVQRVETACSGLKVVGPFAVRPPQTPYFEIEVGDGSLSSGGSVKIPSEWVFPDSDGHLEDDELEGKVKSLVEKKKKELKRSKVAVEDKREKDNRTLRELEEQEEAELGKKLEEYKDKLARNSHPTGLVDDNGEKIWAVLEDDGLYHSYVGPNVRDLSSLKGYRSKSTAKISGELIRILEEADYNADLGTTEQEPGSIGEGVTAEPSDEDTSGRAVPAFESNLEVTTAPDKAQSQRNGEQADPQRPESDQAGETEDQEKKVKISSLGDKEKSELAQSLKEVKGQIDLLRQIIVDHLPEARSDPQYSKMINVDNEGRGISAGLGGVEHLLKISGSTVEDFNNRINSTNQSVEKLFARLKKERGEWVIRLSEAWQEVPRVVRKSEDATEYITEELASEEQIIAAVRGRLYEKRESLGRNVDWPDILSDTLSEF